MKAVPGLIIALVLGGAAVVFNWIYLERKAAQYEVVEFLGISDSAQVRVGETLEESDFAQVPVPKRYADRLKKFVHLYEDRNTVKSTKATRDYQGGDLVHLEDYRTPATEIQLEDEERLIWVTVESRAFVPALVSPGDELTFVFPLVGSAPGVAEANSLAETLGPFTIGALGTRLGDVNVARGHNVGRAEERQIGIIARVDSGKLEPKALRLLELTTGSNRTFSVALHPRKKKD